MTPGAVRKSGWGGRGLLVVLGALGVVLVAVIVAVPRLLGALLEQGLCGLPRDGASGPSCEVDHVSFAWPARLRVEGLRLRLTGSAEPAVAVQSAAVQLAPLRWLSGAEFLSVTLDGPRVVLHRQPDGSYDLLAFLRAPGPPKPESPNASHVYLTAPDPDDSVEPDYDPATAQPELPETDDAGSGADPGEHPSIDGSIWTRIDDPFTVIHGALTIAGGTVLIVDPAAGAETSLHDVRLALRVQTDEVITFDVSARQRGREGREGALAAKGSIAFNAGVRFWYDPAETLRRLELDAEARLAPCTVGDLDVGGDFRATVHGAHATLNAAGALNQGTVSVRAEARVVPGTRAVAGDLHIATQHVGLVPALAPILAPLNPIFDVGKGRLAGRLDTTWTGGWSASPTGRQRSAARGRIEVHELALSGAPLVVALRDWLGEPGDALAGDLLAPEIRSANGRLSYERMTLTGPERDLTFAGAVAEDGVVRLSCEASARRPPPGSADVGAPLRVLIGGWVDEPRLRR